MIAAPDIPECQRQTAYQERRLAKELRRERAGEKTVAEADALGSLKLMTHREKV